MKRRNLFALLLAAFVVATPLSNTFANGDGEGYKNDPWDAIGYGINPEDVGNLNNNNSNEEDPFLDKEKELEKAWNAIGHGVNPNDVDKKEQSSPNGKNTDEENEELKAEIKWQEEWDKLSKQNPNKENENENPNNNLNPDNEVILREKTNEIEANEETKEESKVAEVKTTETKKADAKGGMPKTAVASTSLLAMAVSALGAIALKKRNK